MVHGGTNWLAPSTNPDRGFSQQMDNKDGLIMGLWSKSTTHQLLQIQIIHHIDLQLYYTHHGRSKKLVDSTWPYLSYDPVLIISCRWAIETKKKRTHETWIQDQDTIQKNSKRINYRAEKLKTKYILINMYWCCVLIRLNKCCIFILSLSRYISWACSSDNLLLVFFFRKICQCVSEQRDILFDKRFVLSYS